MKDDFFDKEFAKTERKFRIFAVVLAIIITLGLIFLYIIVGQIGKEVDSQGGLGSSIGHFIKNIKEGAK